MGISDLWQIFSQWGPLFGIVIVALFFFLWKDWKRENRLQDRVEALEKKHEELVFPMLEKCTVVIAQNTTIMERLEKVMERCIFSSKHETQNTLERLFETEA